MPDEFSVDHHYVPVFLLKRWALPGSSLLRGYFWDERTGRLRSNERGPKAFCNVPHLLSAPTNPRRPDEVEREFFWEIDDRGAKITSKLIDGVAISQLEVDQLIEFVLSLEARRPAVVQAARTYGPKKVAALLNRDPELLARLESEGIDSTPADYVASLSTMSMEDEALEVVQRLTTNSRVAQAIRSSNWMVRKLHPSSQPLALGDRPLIRAGGLQSNFVWFLPIGPDTALAMTATPEDRLNVSRSSDKQFSRQLNVGAASQSDKYVFWTPDGPTAWLERWLKARASDPRQTAEQVARNVTY